MLPDKSSAALAMQQEWGRLRNKGVWVESNPREWDDVRREANASGDTVHMG